MNTLDISDIPEQHNIHPNNQSTRILTVQPVYRIAIPNLHHLSDSIKKKPTILRFVGSNIFVYFIVSDSYN